MSTWRRAIRYFRPDAGLIALLVVLVGISFVISLVQPWVVPMLIDMVFDDRPRTDWVHRAFARALPADPMGRILALAALGLLLKILQEATWFLGRVMLNNRIRYNGLARVRLDLYDKLQRLSLDYHRGRPLGDSIYRLTTDTQGFFGILDTLIGASIACVTVVALVWIMLSRSVSLTLVALGAVPLLVVANLYYAREINRRSLAAKQTESDFLTTVQRSMGAIALIQSFCKQVADFARFKRVVDATNAANWRVNWMEALYPFTMQAVFAISGALIFGYGGYLAYRDQMILHKPDGITAGDLIAFMAYVTALTDPLSRITGFKAAIQINVAAAHRVFVVLDTPVTVEDHPEARAIAKEPRTLALEDVTFRYPGMSPDARPILDRISARVTPGQFAAFVGASGAGKSTLFSLLPRFYDVSGGAVRLDGHDVREIHLADVRKHIAAVQQDSPLFPGTIAENIAFARPDATLAEIVDAAKAAGAHAFIEGLDHGYETEVIENGQNLSGGQRQRLALARALLAETPILLLDEPTSAQDPHHAKAILQTLLSLRGGRTILLVTHDLSLVEEADQIFVLQNGRLVECGVHEDLLRRAGTYYDLRHASSHTNGQTPSHNVPTTAGRALRRDQYED
jgi:subfamily B ATP-binding cassette protein MsbA